MNGFSDEMNGKMVQKWGGIRESTGKWVPKKGGLGNQRKKVIFPYSDTRRNNFPKNPSMIPLGIFYHFSDFLGFLGSGGVKMTLFLYFAVLRPFFRMIQGQNGLFFAFSLFWRLSGPFFPILEAFGVIFPVFSLIKWLKTLFFDWVF